MSMGAPASSSAPTPTRRRPTTASCPAGTAYISDLGMTGDYDSVLGMERDEPIRRFTRKIPSGRFEPANGAATLCGLAVELDGEGHAVRLAPVRLGGGLDPAEPTFW